MKQTANKVKMASMQEFESETSPSSARAPACPVSEFVARARRAVEGGLPQMWVRGEVMNFTRAASGHWYFALRDERAQINCAMMARFAAVAAPPQNGDQAEVFGHPTIYAPRGQFQLMAQFIRMSGAGRLHQIFTQRKQALAARGWFDSARKRPLPSWPGRLGVVCSPQGAAIRDVLKTVKARMPAVSVVIYPAPAQGGDAAPKIAEAIRLAGKRNECDALIVCRGGGGMEELWAYNEEEVAAAIVESPVPVVSGIGHETDETLADYASDFRAPTPTAAAVAAVPDRAELKREAVLRGRHLHREATRRRDELAQRLDFAARSLAGPEAARLEKARRFAAAADAFTAAADSGFARARERTRDFAARIRACSPLAALSAAEADLRAAERVLRAEVSRAMRSAHSRADAAARTAAALNPENILRRGFSVVRDENGGAVSDAERLRVGGRVRIQFARGGAEAKVEKISRGGRF